MDVLDDILTSLRLTGGVVIDAEFSGDFCVQSEFTPDHFAPFFPVPETLIAYHYVRTGRLVVEVDGMPPIEAKAGDIIILPRNDTHRLASKAGLPTAEMSEVIWLTRDKIHRVETGSGGEKTECWCGFLGTAKSGAHPLLDALPPLLMLDVAGGEGQWLESSMRFVAEESPPPDVVAKLAEVFLAQAIRDYTDELPPGSKGWLRGLSDPAVAKALSIIHTRYAEDLDVEGLAREAGVSRTVLGERFAELIGEPPMRYCARWRMRLAANMLLEGRQNTANVAYAVGFNSEAAFNRAFKREYGMPPASWRRRMEEEQQAQARSLGRRELPPQQIRHCTAKDGTRLAYSVVGDGPPLVKTANWLNHIEYDWDSPLWRHWIEEFTNGHSLVRYDERGNGLSDWDTPELSLAAFVNDLESVVDCVGLETFDLLAISQGAAVAVAYAVRHPERVRHLVICNGYAAGWAVRSDAAELARREAMITLAEIGWGADNPAYRQLFTNIYIPDATPKQMGWFNEMQRVSASPENAVRLQRTLGRLDVRSLLPEVRTPTLIFHCRDDQAVPFSQGEELASAIPGARFVPLESRNHILLATDPAWATFTEVTREFLKGGGLPATALKEAAPRPESDPRPKELRVTGTPTVFNWLTRHIGEFIEDNPDLSVRLNPDARVIDFARDDFDCALRSVATAPAGLAAEKLFKVDFVPMCSPDFLARHPELKSPADLRAVPRITPADSWWNDWWEHFGVDAPTGLPRGIDMGSQVLDGVAAMGGQGVALLTPFFWRDEIASGRLVCPLPDRIDGKSTYWLVYPKEREEWPKIRRFSAWLRELCDRSEAESRSAA